MSDWAGQADHRATAGAAGTWRDLTAGTVRPGATPGGGWAASWREQQGQPGGEDSADSQVRAASFARFRPQIVGRTMFDYGYPNWGENPPFHAPVFVLTHRGQERIDKNGGTSYTFVTGGI